MSDEDQDGELKRLEARSAYPTHLADLFREGFTVPEALRMNSVYGKFASRDRLPSPEKDHAVGFMILALAMHRARRLLRVI